MFQRIVVPSKDQNYSPNNTVTHPRKPESSELYQSKILDVKHLCYQVFTEVRLLSAIIFLFYLHLLVLFLQETIHNGYEKRIQNMAHTNSTSNYRLVTSRCN